jgi:3'-phosphoadenosine 5'-phosphosulfate (PAPS) 3'-phosphatase
VTEADLRIQRTIETNLKELFPGISVKGEEDPSMYMKYEPSIKPTEVIRSNGGNQWVKWDEMK